MIDCQHWKESNQFFKGYCSLKKFDGLPTYGQCVDLCKLCKNSREWLDDYISKLPKSESPDQKAKREQAQKEIKTSVAKLPSNTQRLVDLDAWVKDIAVPFEQATGLLFSDRQHKLDRDEVCRACEFMAKTNDLMTCTKCNCCMGKLIADGSEPDPHELMGKLGQKGKTVDAVRIKSATWYAAKKCSNWQADDKWAQVDKKYLTDEQLKQRNNLYKD